MWGNQKSHDQKQSRALTATSSAPRTWSWDDTETLASSSFSTSIDMDDAPSSPGYTVLAGVTHESRDMSCDRKPSLEGDPVESAIAEWENDLEESRDVTSSDESFSANSSFDSTMCTSLDEIKVEEEVKTRRVRSRVPVKRVPVKRAPVKSRGPTKPRAPVKSRALVKSHDLPRDPPRDPLPPLTLTLTRITSDSAFVHRFLACEDALLSLSEDYLRSKRLDVTWSSPRQIDHAIFDYAFVSRKSGLPKQSVVTCLRATGSVISNKRPVRWTQSDDRVILYLKEVEGLTWKESALMIRYRHSWQAVQMRYLRTLCRLTGTWSEQDEERLVGVVSRDWAARWRRVATEMGPQFPVERVYRRMKEMVGERVDLEVLDGVEEGEGKGREVKEVLGMYAR